MWGIRYENTLDYKSTCYIAKKLKPIEDEYGNQLEVYGEPNLYEFNIQPVSNENSSETVAFGELIPRMKVAVIPKKLYEGMFEEFDRAYLDGIEPIDESFYGEKANYRIYSVRPQNTIIKVYFLKLVKGETTWNLKKVMLLKISKII